MRRCAVSAFLLAFLLPMPAAEPAEDGTMVVAARRYVASLGEADRSAGVLPFASPNRLRWTFLPGRRRGLSLRAMSPAQRERALALVRTALSEAGWRKLQGIFALEAVLQRALPATQRRRDPGWRDPLGYTLTVFGRPDAVAPWGWRLGGHHVSLNVSLRRGVPVSAAPFFFGASPARVASGPQAPLAPLAAQEAGARRLVAALDAGQRRAALRGLDVPRGILLGPSRRALDVRPEGVAAAALRADQRGLLWAVVREYAGSLAAPLAARLIERARQGDPTRVHFLWRGPTRGGGDVYFRIQGPDFALEHLNQGNHVHSTWRDPVDEFGASSLRGER